MIDLIREVGKGKRGTRHLSYTEASRAADSILDGIATPAQTAAFLMAQQIKPESTQELLAFIHALRRRAAKHPVSGSMDFAGIQYGRSRTFLAGLPAAFVLNACRVPVTLHDSPLPQGSAGLRLKDILLAWGIQTDRFELTSWIEGAERSGLFYVPTEQCCPPLAALRPLREEIGIRTVFDTAEHLLRPSDSPYMSLGVTPANAFERTADLLLALGVQRALLTNGSEGTDDVLTDRKTRIFLLRDGVMDIHIVDPHTFGMSAPLPEVIWTDELQAHATLDVLQDQASHALRKAVVLNSALRLWVAERTESIEEGIEYAEYALDQGIAWKHYLKWRTAIGSPALG